MNGQDVSSTIETVNSTSRIGNNFFLNRTGENTIRLVFFKGKSYILTVTKRQDILDFVLNLEESLKGRIRGLFGNFDDDDTNDLISPNGVTLSVNASDTMIHDFGKSCKCI